MKEDQEFQCLREELNWLCKLHCEQIYKVINIVLVTWGGVIYFLGAIVAKLIETGQNVNDIRTVFIISCFIGAVIFLVSNEILFILARKYYNVANDIFERGSYILVFHEKRPSKNFKMGEDLCWESVTFDIMNPNINKKYDEYTILNLISLVLILILSGVSFLAARITFDIMYIFPSFCVVFLIRSIYLFITVRKNTSSMNYYRMRVNHLKKYFQYALETGYYTPDDIKDKFGDFYERCNQYLQNSITPK